MHVLSVVTETCDFVLQPYTQDYVEERGANWDGGEQRPWTGDPLRQARR